MQSRTIELLSQQLFEAIEDKSSQSYENTIKILDKINEYEAPAKKAHAEWLEKFFPEEKNIAHVTPFIINKLNKDGSSVLLEAMKHGKYYLVPILLKDGANPNFRDKTWRTAADYAIQNQNYSLFELFQQYNSLFNAELVLASLVDGKASVSDYKNIQHLVSLIKDLNIIYKGTTLFNYFASNLMWDNVKYLLDFDINIHFKDYLTDHTLLDYILENDQLDLYKLICKKKGLVFNSEDNFLKALQDGAFKIVNSQLEQNIPGWDYLVTKAYVFEVPIYYYIELLVMHKGNLNIIIKETNESILMHAVKYNELDHVKKIVEAGANIALINIHQQNAIYFAQNFRDTEILTYLTERSDKSEWEKTLTNHVTHGCSHSPHCYHLLIKHAANLNVISDNFDHDTVLIYLAWKGLVTGVNNLIEAKADVNIMNKRGYTALDYALSKKHDIKPYITHGAEIVHPSFTPWFFEAARKLEDPLKLQCFLILSNLLTQPESLHNLNLDSKQQAEIHSPISKKLNQHLDPHFPPVLANIITGYSMFTPKHKGCKSEKQSNKRKLQP